MIHVLGQMGSILRWVVQHKQQQRVPVTFAAGLMAAAVGCPALSKEQRSSETPLYLRHTP